MNRFGTLGGHSEMVELEAQMTQSAFAHEYALMSLNDYIPYSQKQVIIQEIEFQRDAYFSARERLLKKNPERLFVLEEELRFQKEMILRHQSTLH